MFSFDLQRFGGKGGYQSAPAVVQEMTPEQKQAIAYQTKYLGETSPVLSQLVQKGATALDAYSPPDFNKYYNQGMNTTLDASNMSKSLAQGLLPSAYQANMQQAVTDAVSPYQTQFNTLANKGVINSTLGGTWSSDMARAATAAANSAYNQNLASASGLVNQYGSTATAPLAYQSTFYNTASQPAKDYLTLGTATYQPTGQAAGQAYQWQQGLSAPAQNNYVQQPGFGSVLGTLGGAALGRMKPW